MITHPTYELKVYYPYDGPHSILQWYSYNEGNHLIIARSKKQAEQTFKNVLAKYDDAVVKSFLQVNIVAPSKEHCEAYSNHCFKNEVSIFVSHYCYLAKEYFDIEGKLPSKLAFCTKFVPVDVDADEDENHWNCTNCHTKIVLVNGSFENMFLQNQEFYAKRFPSPIDKKLVKSRAPIQDTGKSLYKVSPFFGDHQPGIELNEVANIESKGLFFYQDPQGIDTTIVDSMVSEAKESFQKWKQQRDEAWKKECEEKDQLRFNDLLSIFG